MLIPEHAIAYYFTVCEIIGFTSACMLKWLPSWIVGTTRGEVKIPR